MLSERRAAGKDFSELVASYGLRLHAAAGDDHHVVSPLGAWLLLALCAPLTSGGDRKELERVLGCDAETARRGADELLANPHPALGLAFAAWYRGDLGAGIDAWCRTLPSCATTGPMPTPAAANSWASEHTRGLVESMPVAIADDSRLLLATAVATEVQWTEAFQLVPAAELGGAWATRVNRAMRRHHRHGDVVAHTKVAGPVGVSIEHGQGGLDVISVIAAPDVEPSRVLAAAYGIAGDYGQGPANRFISAFDLPRAGHAWSVREQVLKNFVGPKRMAFSEVTMPAWIAETLLEGLISTPGTGFAEIVSAYFDQLPPDPRGDRGDAMQVARATFDTNGFSAAALTVAHFVGATMPPPPRRTIARTVEVRFDRPFAVVAVTNTNWFRRAGRELWRGLPAFAAWVTEPMEPSEPNEKEWQGAERP